VQGQSLQPYPQPLGKPLRIAFRVALVEHQGTSSVFSIGFDGEGVAEVFAGSPGPAERIDAFGLDMVECDQDGEYGQLEGKGGHGQFLGADK